MKLKTFVIRGQKCRPDFCSRLEPHEPETDYGYVLPHKDAGRPCRVGTRAVSAFVEKPGVDMTFELMMGGGLWNTMTMVFKLDTLLELVRRVHPALYLNFSRILEAVGTVEEQTTVDDVYERAGAGQLFKRDHDEDCRSPSAIALSPSRAEGFWSDWGSREHVLQAFRRLDQVHSEETQTDFREQKPGNGTQRAMASQPSLGYRSKALTRQVRATE